MQVPRDEVAKVEKEIPKIIPHAREVTVQVPDLVREVRLECGTTPEIVKSATACFDLDAQDLDYEEE